VKSSGSLFDDSELICKNAAGFSAPKLKKAETVGPKRCSAAKSAILQALWDRKIDQNDRFVGSPNAKSFSEDKRAIWIGKGNLKNALEWVSVLIDSTIKLEMGGGRVLARLPRDR
jgi:hypothetical protein